MRSQLAAFTLPHVLPKTCRTAISEAFSSGDGDLAGCSFITICCFTYGNLSMEDQQEVALVF